MDALQARQGALLKVSKNPHDLSLNDLTSSIPSNGNRLISPQQLRQSAAAAGDTYIGFALKTIANAVEARNPLIDKNRDGLWNIGLPSTSSVALSPQEGRLIETDSLLTPFIDAYGGINSSIKPETLNKLASSTATMKAPQKPSSSNNIMQLIQLLLMLLMLKRG